jgi:hypothetical protein
MNIKQRLGLAAALALTLAACGSNDLTDDAGTTYVPPTPGQDAAVVTPTIDAAPVIPVETDPYVWVVIQDTEQKACTTNGPGVDVDAVAKLAADGTVLGYGMNATYTANPGGFACESTDCNGKNCKYAANSTTFTLPNLVKRTEGPVDGQVNDVGDDVGYFSLNAGTLSIQIGNLNGTGVAQELKSGDWIAVYEVDKSYITAGAAAANCVCAAEHYTVSLQSKSGAKVLPLNPAVYSPDNTTCALTATSTEGCGSTTFAVP